MKRHVPRRSENTYGYLHGVHYFLGNIYQHVNHALPLYRELGGTFVVLSEEAYDFCVRCNLSVILIDNQPELSLQFPSQEISATIEYLNKNARVVIYYDIFEFSKDITSKQVMLTHGNSFKNYYIPWRQKIFPHFDLIAGLGPDWERRTLLAGAKPEQILRVGLARGDEIIKDAGQVRYRKAVARKLGLDPRKQIITYMPTWWGPTSVNDIGKNIIFNIPEEYSFIFRPHPDTPPEVIAAYERTIHTEKLNSVYVPDGRYPGVDLLKIYAASSLFIGDMSSVVLDALLTDKPVLFALGREMLDKQDMEALRPIERLISSTSITLDNIGDLRDIISHSLSTTSNIELTRKLKQEIYYGLEGDNVNQTVDAVKALIA